MSETLSTAPLAANRADGGQDGGAGWLRVDPAPARGAAGGVLHLGGVWTLDTAARLDRETQALEPGRITTVDLSAMTRMDTVGCWLVHRTLAALRMAGNEPAVDGLPDRFRGLFEEVVSADRPTQIDAPRVGFVVEILTRVGEATFGLCREARSLTAFFGMVLVKTLRLFAQPQRLRITSLVHHMEQTGLHALPIIALLSFLIGIVLAYQAADQLRQFGAELLAVNLLGISILRELGVLITAIIVAGRSGSAFTAQIGTMKVNQEVDAMETLGLDPIDILVLPRILALIVTLPLLVFLANIVGLVGGGLMSWAVLGIPPSAFLLQFQEAVPIIHLWVGLIKAPVFAFVIAMVGCYEGLKVTGSAQSVGAQTTRAVVEAIFLVILIDAAFSILFSTIGM